MAKTFYENGDDFGGVDANYAYYTNGGHKHDGVDDDGHAQKIDLATETAGVLPAGQVTGVVPIGLVLPYAFSGVPDDTWLECDGLVFNEANYPALPPGMNPGYPSEYRTPPTPGRVVIGTGALGSDTYVLRDLGGAAEVALQPDEGAIHNHGLVTNSDLGGTALAEGGGGSVGSDTTDDSIGGEPHENRMPFMALNHIIKAK